MIAICVFTTVLLCTLMLGMMMGNQFEGFQRA
jgi:hypothetical protein